VQIWVPDVTAEGFAAEARRNPHLLVTKQTKSTTAPASPYYLSHILDPARASGCGCCAAPG
jgi:hypothetical protein